MSFARGLRIVILVGGLALGAGSTLGKNNLPMVADTAPDRLAWDSTGKQHQVGARLDTIASAQNIETQEIRYRATIRRTTYGVAHIEAADLPSLGFGDGYAQAEDHLCSIADQLLRVRGERARYLGRGEADRHLNSDVLMRGLQTLDRADEELAAQPEHLRQWVDGFAAGYNH